MLPFSVGTAGPRLDYWLVKNQTCQTTNLEKIKARKICSKSAKYVKTQLGSKTRKGGVALQKL